MTDRLEEILELGLVKCLFDKEVYSCCGTDYPVEVVRSRLMKLDMEHIARV